MSGRRLFFITTNAQWSGSEELWSRALALERSKGADVSFSAGYEANQLTALPARRLPWYKQPASLMERASVKLGIRGIADPVAAMATQIADVKPSMVIISQGDVTGAADIMDACQRLTVPYVVIFQLVAEVHFLFLDPAILPRLIKGYRLARKNYFVSAQNESLLNNMIASDLTNTQLVFNPCKVKEHAPPAWPKAPGPWSMAMVGRLECFHKGHDLVLDVMAQQKWKERPLTISVYGDGPHRQLIADNIARLGIKNVVLRGHASNVRDIWAENQLLLMASRFEGQALTLIEALACDRAAVVTDVGGAAGLVENGREGFVAAFASVHALDAAMEEAWRRRDEWEAMGQAAGRALKAKHPADEVAWFGLELEKALNMDNSQ